MHTKATVKSFDPCYSVTRRFKAPFRLNMLVSINESVVRIDMYLELECECGFTRPHLREICHNKRDGCICDDLGLET